MKYVIKRSAADGGGYVTPPGSEHSYSRNLRSARTYPSRDAAEADLCPENECVVSVEEEMRL